MASDVEICNLAISHLGTGKEIANLENEKTEESIVCRRFFNTARDATLRDFPWPFATKVLALALIEKDPTTEWAFSYQYPTDCLKMRKILSGIRNDDRQSRVSSQRANKDNKEVIFTDQENAVLEYTLRVTNAELFQPDFILALSFRIAGYIAPRLTSGDPTGMGARAFQLYLLELDQARATSVNEQQDDEIPESEFIQERGG